MILLAIQGLKSPYPTQPARLGLRPEGGAMLRRAWPSALEMRSPPLAEVIEKLRPGRQRGDEKCWRCGNLDEPPIFGKLVLGKFAELWGDGLNCCSFLMFFVCLIKIVQVDHLSYGSVGTNPCFLDQCLSPGMLTSWVTSWPKMLWYLGSSHPKLTLETLVQVTVFRALLKCSKW